MNCAAALVVPACITLALTSAVAAPLPASYPAIKKFLDDVPAIDTHDHLWKFDDLPGLREAADGSRGDLRVEDARHIRRQILRDNALETFPGLKSKLWRDRQQTLTPPQGAETR